MRIDHAEGTLDRKLPRSAHFLEHAAREGAMSEVIVGDGDGRLHVSRDLGASFSTVRHRFTQSVSKCFTLKNGARLVRLKGSAETLLCDQDFEVRASVPFASAEWHGSWSICESETGVVMFGEYVERAEAVQIWRSRDGGESWTAVLRLTSLAVEPGAVADVRHVHTCTWTGGSSWIVSTGDEARHCRMWSSENDGLTWTELRDWEVAGGSIAAPHRASLLRHTAEVWDGNVAYWVTDDLLRRGRSAFVRADTATRRLEMLADLSANEMRTLVRHGQDFIAISEVKHDLSHADVYLLSRDGKIVHEQKIANPRQQKLSFTRSRSSHATTDGVFFTFDDGLIGEKCRFVRWVISA